MAHFSEADCFAMVFTGNHKADISFFNECAFYSGAGDFLLKSSNWEKIILNKNKFRLKAKILKNIYAGKNLLHSYRQRVYDVIEY